MSRISYAAQQLQIKTYNLRETIGLLTIALAILWTPLSIWYLHFDSSARVPFMFFILSFFLLFKDFKRTALKKPITIYICVAIYMVINGLMKGSDTMYEKDGAYLIFIHILEPVVTMMITTVLARKNFDATLKWLSTFLFIFCIFCLLNSGFDEDGRMNSEINANEMSIHCPLLCGMLLLMYLRKKAKTSLIYLILWIVPLTVIFQTGSRMALGMTGIIIVIVWMFKINFKRIVEPIRSLIIASILTFSGMYIVNNTMIGERLKETTEQGDELTLATGTILDKYGDRGLQYYYSWDYFLDNPITGIGFHQWQKYSPTEHVCHSEYMVQYVECGLLSFIPYILFLFLLYRNLASKIRHTHGIQNSTIVILMAMLLSIIYSNTVLWSYNIHAVFITFALVFTYPKYLIK